MSTSHLQINAVNKGGFKQVRRPYTPRCQSFFDSGDAAIIGILYHGTKTFRTIEKRSGLTRLALMNHLNKLEDAKILKMHKRPEDKNRYAALVSDKCVPSMEYTLSKINTWLCVKISEQIGEHR